METCRYCGMATGHAPDCPADQEQEPRDLNNLDLAHRILVDGTPEDLAELRSFVLEKGMSPESFEKAVASRRLREKVHEEMREEKARRAEEHPEPTEDELRLGAYMENIEPQVREAIIAMRRKGYETVSSGFGSYCFQSLVVAHDQFAELPDDVREKLKDMGVTLREHMFWFEPREIDMEKMTEEWNAIADALPDLGHEAAPTTHSQAQLFRKKHGHGTDDVGT